MTLTEAKELVRHLHSGRCHAEIRNRWGIVVLGWEGASKRDHLATEREGDGQRIHFTGGQFGEHSLDVGASSEERVIAHWRGYCGANFRRVSGGAAHLGERIGVGDRVGFTRGQYGYWHGTVEHIGAHRSAEGAWAPFATVRIRRRNGSVGRYRVDITALTLSFKAQPVEG